jgi:hypothetical protein
MKNTETDDCKEKRESSSSLFPTTDTMREKSKVFTKCFICVLKVLRALKITKPSKKPQKQTDNAI